jgi:hypothetical protein
MRLTRPVVLLLAVIPGSLIAQEVPLSNWTVPPYRGTTSVQGGLVTMADVTPGIAFVGVSPCRLVDTRQAGFPAGYGVPALAAGAPRNFDLNSDPLCTGIPSGVDAYSLNVTATTTQGPGFILIYPQGGAQPPVSTLNYLANETVANAAIVPAGINGGVTVIAGVSGTNLIIDINGYFSDQYNPGVSFHAVSGTVAPAILGENTSSVVGAIAIRGVITSTTPGLSSTALRGINNGTGTSGIGVWGSHLGGGDGVYGTSANHFGVVGEVSGSPDGASGVVGLATNEVGKTYGVYGQSDSIDVGAAGVFGVDGSGATLAAINVSAGIRGESRGGVGVVGVTEIGLGAAVSGYHVDSSGSVVTHGDLGLVVGSAYGVFSYGDYGGSGAKYFVEPHPNDASKVIRFVSLEGNESGTYFRGRGKFQNGLARIPVPEDFRLVTDPDGLTVQVTPIGELATVAVLKMDLTEIVVKSSRSVEFSYTVNGVRKTHKHLTPIGPGREYMPETPDAKMPLYLTEGQKEMLISNGTYRPDGTVNLETARRLGWDKEWEKRGKPAAQPPD